MVFIKKLLEDGQQIVYDPADQDLVEVPKNTPILIKDKGCLKQFERSPPKKRPVDIIYNGSPEKSPLRYQELSGKEGVDDNLSNFRQRLQKGIKKELFHQTKIKGELTL